MFVDIIYTTPYFLSSRFSFSPAVSILQSAYKSFVGQYVILE
ncbi:hypothetical protein LINPERHAP1_LOCUS23211 [Linum perenne]